MTIEQVMFFKLYITHVVMYSNSNVYTTYIINMKVYFDCLSMSHIRTTHQIQIQKKFTVIHKTTIFVTQM